MLDLQRMDYAYLESKPPAPAESSHSFSLNAKDGAHLGALKSTGSTLFSFSEEEFDEESPEEFGRRIKSVRVRLPGVEKSQSNVNAKLSLVSHRECLDRNKSKERSILRSDTRQRIVLLSQDTDTKNKDVKSGRKKPFENCGVESTWMLTFPAAVDAISKKKTSSAPQLLQDLDDVIVDIEYVFKY